MVDFRRRVHPLVGALIATSLVLSIAAAQNAQLYLHLALVPTKVWHGEVWRLVTWTFLEGSPLALVYTCLTLWWFGGDLVDAWGPRILARYAAATVLGAALATAVVAILSPAAWHGVYSGGWALGDALVIAWAYAYPEREVRLYMFLVVGGPTLAYLTIGVNLLFAIFYGPLAVWPELVACAGALLYATGGRPWPAAWTRGGTGWRRRPRPDDDDPRWVN